MAGRAGPHFRRGRGWAGPWPRPRPRPHATLFEERATAACAEDRPGLRDYTATWGIPKGTRDRPKILSSPMVDGRVLGRQQRVGGTSSHTYSLMVAYFYPISHEYVGDI